MAKPKFDKNMKSHTKKKVAARRNKRRRKSRQ